jgi:sigma-B regulation protein RsbU (phosphoserine phosphatase)
MYVTLFYGILDTRSGKLTWSIGGHAPPWLLPANGKPHQIEGPRGYMVGMFDDAAFDSTETPLNRGDTILVHTDGITDAENADREMFGKARLSKLIQSLTPTDGTDGASVAGVAHNVVRAVHDFTSGAPQADDITLLAVRFGDAE